MLSNNLIGYKKRLGLAFGGTVVMGTLCVLLMVNPIPMDYDWLDYSNSDEGPDMECNCSAILRGDPTAIQQSKILAITQDFQKRTKISDEQYMELTKDCPTFRATHKYLEFPLSQKEESFPLAYSIVIHHKVQTFERLLRAIYAPQNFYCIHVDRKASASVFLAILAISSCFDNVFLASRQENVVYASWSRVQADLNCMSDLSKASQPWKYFINLCGQDFPIKTNLEKVESLQALAGGNSLESEAMPENKKVRWQKRHQIVDGHIERTPDDKPPPPFDTPIFSGGAYIVVSYKFVKYILEDPKTQALMQWANDTYSPDEFLWASLQRMPGVPGALRHNNKFDMTDMNAISRLVKWSYFEGPEEARWSLYPPCQGRHVRGICVYGAGDLQWMLKQHHLFANKFDADMDPIAIHCLEKYLRQKALAAIQ